MRWNWRRKKSSPETTSFDLAEGKSISQRMKSLYVPIHLRSKELKRKELLILLLLALGVMLAVAVVLVTVDFGSSYQLQDDTYQYYGGNTANIESGAKLKRTGKGQTLLVQDGYSAETTLPVYLKDSPGIVLTTDMLYFAPRRGSYERVVYFSEVECAANGTITVSRDGKTSNPQQGFLYDGKDFYLFLEPVSVSFNGYTMDLPALSYAEAVYGGYMMIFNYETKEFFIELSDGTGTAQPPSGDYVISLLGDSMTLHDDTRVLLATRPELFDPIV